jgi:hypothetical protein
MSTMSRILVVSLILAASCSSNGNDDADAGDASDADSDSDSDADSDSDGDTDADTDTDSDTETDPTFEVEFVASDADRFYGYSENGGGFAFGVANGDAADGNVTELLFHGDGSLGPDDSLSPAYATEIGTNVGTFSYGEYRARLQLASCAPNEELVNGVFTYFNDGEDHDSDGLTDNSEIDIEILCSDPSIISLTIWTEYVSDADGENMHVSRAIDTATGDYSDTLNYTTDLGSGNNPDLLLDGFPSAAAFYEMGFDWSADSVRYFIVFGGEEVTLWEYDDPTKIPSLPAPFLFNVWHSSDWWDEAGEGDYPANDAVMRIDWFRYWAAD